MWVTDLFPDGRVEMCGSFVLVENSCIVSDITAEQLAHLNRSARWEWVAPVKAAAKKTTAKKKKTRTKKRG